MIRLHRKPPWVSISLQQFPWPYVKMLYWSLAAITLYLLICKRVLESKIWQEGFISMTSFWLPFISQLISLSKITFLVSQRIRTGIHFVSTKHTQVRLHFLIWQMQEEPLTTSVYIWFRSNMLYFSIFFVRSNKLYI